MNLGFVRCNHNKENDDTLKKQEREDVDIK